MSEPPKWPLVASCFSAPAVVHYNEVACIHVPLGGRVYHPFARSFDEFRVHREKNWDVLWRRYLQVFLRTAEDAAVASPGRTTLFCEGIPGADGVSIHGYRFWLVVGGGFDEGASILDECAERTVGFYGNQVRKFREEGDKDAGLFIERLAKGGIRHGEEWKGIPNRRTWGGIVSHCTGTSGIWDTTESLAAPIATTHYHPAVAFATGMHWEEDDAAMDEAFLGSAAIGRYLRNGRAGKELCFHDPRMVYTIPLDLVRLRLWTYIFPHVQVQEDQLNFAAFKLIPSLLSAAPQEVSDRQERRKRQRTAMLQDFTDDHALGDAAMESAECATERTTDMLPTQPMSTIDSSLEAVIKEENITPYHALARVSSSVRNACRRFHMDRKAALARAGPTAAVDIGDGDGEHIVAEMGRVFGHAPHLSTEPVRTHLGDRAKLGVRRMQILIRRALQDIFEKSVPRSSKHSPSSQAMRRSIDMDGLLDRKINRGWIEAKRRKWADRGSGLYPALQKRMLHAIECSFKVNHMHDVVWLMWRASLDAWRYKKGMHFHVILLSHNGMTSKSFIMKLVMAFMVNGTFATFVHQTTAATSVDGDVTGNPNNNGWVKCFDEFPPGFFDTSEGGTSTSESRIKAEMTEGVMKSLVFAQVDDGTGKEVRTSRTSYMECQGCIFGATNYNIDEISPPMLSRAMFVLVSEMPPSDRPLDSKMLEAMRSEMEDSVKTSEFATQMKQIQAIHADKLEPMIHAGILPDVSMDGASLLLDKLGSCLRKDKRVHFFHSISARALSRLSMAMRLASLTSVALDLIAEGTGVITTADVVKMERRLFVTAEQAVMEIAMLSAEILPPLPLAVEQCIRAVVRRKLSAMDTERSGFDRMFARAESTQQSHLGDGVVEREWNYLSFPVERLVSEVRMMIPDYMDDFQASDASIRKSLEDLRDQTVLSHIYEKHPTINVLQVRTSSTPRKMPLVVVRTFKGIIASVQIHVSLVGGLIVMNDRFKASLASGTDSINQWVSIKSDVEFRMNTEKEQNPQLTPDEMWANIEPLMANLYQGTLADIEDSDLKDDMVTKHMEDINDQRKRNWPGAALTTDWDLLDTVADESTSVRHTSKDILAGHLRDILSSKHQLKRRLVFGSGKTYDSVRSFTAEAHAGSKNLSVKYLDKHRAAQVLNVDIDQYALQRHDDRLGISPLPISEASLGRVLSFGAGAGVGAPPLIAAGDESDADDPDGSSVDRPQLTFPDGAYFFGKPVSDVSPDLKNQRLVRTRRSQQVEEKISHPCTLSDLDMFATDYSPDVDFTADDYTLGNGFHWDDPGAFSARGSLPPQNFGFLDWSGFPVVRMAQYKSVAEHPLVRQDLVRRRYHLLDQQ